VRYEALASHPEGMAESLAAFLDVPPAPLCFSLARAHARSVGRWRRDLAPQTLAEVEQEAGELLRSLGYA